MCRRLIFNLKGGIMKTYFPHSNLFRIKSIIIIALLVMMASNFIFAQLSAEDSLFNEARAYLTNGYYDSAVNSLKKLIELNPNSSNAYGLLGNVYNIKGDFDKAITMYHKCIKLDSSAIPIIANLGNAYIDDGELDSAIAVHKFLTIKDSINSYHFIDLGDAYMKKEDITQAQNCFETVIRLNHYSSLALVNLAMAYFDQKRYTESIDKLFFVRNLDDWYPLLHERLSGVSKFAESEFEEWVEKEPKNSEAHYYYAFSLWYTNERGDAIDELETAIELNNKVEKYYLTKAIWLHNEEEYEEAIEDCKQCLALDPDNWMCHNRLSLCYSYLNDRGNALKHSKRSVEIDPFVPQSQLLLGEGYSANEQFKDAIESLKKALDNTISAGVKNPVVYLDLAISYYKNGDYENAMQNAMISKNMKFAEQKVKKDLEYEINQLISNIQQKMDENKYTELPVEENSAFDYYKSGIKYAAKGEFEKAKSKFKDALKVDSLYMAAINSLDIINDIINEQITQETATHLFNGIAFANKNQDATAIDEFTRAIKLNPEYCKTYAERGVSYFYKGEYDNAISDLNKTIEIDTNYDGGYSTRGHVYYKIGQYEKAISDFNKALEINPEAPGIYYNRALAYLENGEYDNALNDFNKAIDINPKYADAYHDRGYLYYKKLGELDKGCADFKKACELGNCNNYNYVKRSGGCR